MVDAATLPPGAYISEEGWFVYGDQAYLPDEWEAHAARGWSESPASGPYLTPREREIVEHLSTGDIGEVNEAADRLHIAESTLKNLLLAARRRTGCTSTLQLVVKTMRGEFD